MKTRVTVLSGLILIGTASAQQGPQANPPASETGIFLTSPSDSPMGAPIPHTIESPIFVTDSGAGQFWASAEYLLWSVRGDRIPALVSTGPSTLPPGSAGVPGTTGAAAVYGDDRINTDCRSGVRFSAGLWLDNCRTLAVGAEVFQLQDPADGFLMSSPGLPVLVRPVFNTATMLPDAQVTAYPGVAQGTVAITTESRLCGAGVFARKTLCLKDYCCIDALIGYRYLKLEEQLVIAEELNATDVTPGAPPPGTQFVLLDAYKTRTQFHGADFGLVAHADFGRFFADVLGKVALGYNVREANVGGASRITVPGIGTENFQGGLYTIGAATRKSDQIFAVVPELRLNIGCRLCECVHVFAGYSVMCWSNVIRPGGQIDQRVDPNQLPPALVPITPRDIPYQSTTLWIHGLNIGIGVSF